jgi:hypothetical protein
MALFLQARISGLHRSKGHLNRIAAQLDAGQKKEVISQKTGSDFTR